MYGKIEDGELKYASKVAIIDGDMVVTNPKESDYIHAGYKKIIDNSPQDAEKEYTPEYIEEENKIIINYKEV